MKEVDEVYFKRHVLIYHNIFVNHITSKRENQKMKITTKVKYAWN